MKILLLTDGIYPFVIGGMQRHSYYLAKFLAKNNFNVTLYHCVFYNQKIPDQNDYSLYFSQEELANIKFYCFAFPKPGKIPGHYLRESYEYSSIIFKHVKNELEKYDFVYVKGFTGWKLLEEKKKGLKSPCIGIKFHGYEMFQRAPSFKVKIQHYMLRKPVKWNTLNSDIVFSYGGIINSIIKSFGVASKNIIEIPSGIEKEWVLEQKHTCIGYQRHFLFIGRFERRKGVEEINRSIQKLKQSKYYQATFHFVGPIPEKNKLCSNKYIKIKYHGVVMDNSKLKNIIDCCDILLAPSYSEGMPNVIMEGMARGLAIISSNVGAISKLVETDNGWLVTPINTQKLYRTIIEAINISPVQLLNKKINL